jgi:hypothetical protein
MSRDWKEGKRRGRKEKGRSGKRRGSGEFGRVGECIEEDGSGSAELTLRSLLLFGATNNYDRSLSIIQFIISQLAS